MARATKQSGAVSAIDFLAAPGKYPASGACAVSGDDVYLKGEVLIAVRRSFLGGEDAEFSFSSFEGKEALLREVLDALATVSLFGGGRRLVVVEEADSFVTEYREQLEDYVARPAPGSLLVLEVKSWPANTRLAKAVATAGLTIDCRSPKEPQLKKWISQRAQSEFGVQIDAAAIDALLNLIPPELGVLSQEIGKLAVVAGDRKTIDVNLVRAHVGGWRARTTWDMIDAAAGGRAAEALRQLDRLIVSGEKPHGILPQMSSTLRRFATALELHQLAEAQRQRLPLRAALSQAGFPPFKLNEAEQQLRQIGRERARKLTDWLLAADLAIKGYNSSDERARIEIERLIVRLSAGESTTAARSGPGADRRTAAARRAVS